MMRWLLLFAAAIGVTDGQAAFTGPTPLPDGAPDPIAVLPPPPAHGSLQERRELDELLAIERNRTPAMLAAAQSDSKTKDASIFAVAIGPGFNLAGLPQTAALMTEVRLTEKAVANRGKEEFRRNRPWVVLPALKHCGKDDDADWSSYPSGHTTMAFSMGGVLARLVPSRANAILARAASYGESRLVCEVHFRSDVTAGEALGLLVADRLLRQHEFGRQFKVAAAELRSHGIPSATDAR